MNKAFTLKLILLGLIFLGSGFLISPAKADNGLSLETVKECVLQHTGDSCISDLQATNDTGYDLDGTASLYISYQGLCSNNQLRNFDGEGISAQFSMSENNWLDFSGWKEGVTTVSGFKIPQGVTWPKLRIVTAPNLCPGKYVFTLELKGTTETAGGTNSYTATTGIGGGGGYVPPAQPTVPTTNNGRVLATSGEGGITTLPNPDGGQVKLVIPAGAVEDDTLFSITPVVMGALTLPSAEQGLFVVDGFAYRITAVRNGQPVTTFSKPLIFTITYTDKQVKGFNLSSLNLYTFQNGAWHLVGSQVNPADHMITSTINHLTLFALLGTRTGNNQPVPQVIKPAVKGASTVVSGGGATAGAGGQGTNQPTGTAGGKVSLKQPTASAGKPATASGEASGGQIAVKPSSRGFQKFLANLGTAWKNLNKTTFYSLLGLLLLIILTLVGIKIWRKGKGR